MVTKYKVISRSTGLQQEANTTSLPSCSDVLLEKISTYEIVAAANTDKDLISEKTAENEEKISNESVNKVYCEKPILWTQIIVAFTVALVHLGFGVIAGFTGIVLPALTNPNSTDVYLSTEQAAIFTSSTGVGLMIGAVPAGLLVTWLGQRVTLVASLPMGVCGWVILYFSHSFPLLVVSRGLLGILIGTCLTACSTYILELAHTSVRGSLMAMTTLFRQMGFLLVAIVGSLGLHWRTVGLVCGLSTFIPPLIVLVFLPNSPRWLATRGRKAEVRSSLKFFRGTSYNYESELNDIFLQIESTKQTNKRFSQVRLLFSGVLLKRFVLLSIIMICMHLTGNIAMAAYNITVFKAAKTGIDEYLSTVLSSVMRVVGTATYITIADRFNRRTLLMVPLFITGLSLLSMGGYFFLLVNDYNTDNIKWLPLASMMIYLLSTGLFIPVIMLLTGELLPTSVRAVGSGIIYWIFSVTMFLVMFTFPYLFEYVGPHWTFWFYSSNAFFIIFLTAVFIPETKGKTLEETGAL